MNNQAPMTSLEYPRDYLSIIRNGLEQTSAPKKIIIIGAGMAGLTAASLLRDAGHHVSIIEANNRIGGRIYTVRDPFIPGNYMEAGAMRFPANHVLLLEYIRKANLPLQRFMNITPHDVIFMNNKRVKYSYYEENPHILGFPLKPSERGLTAIELLLNAVHPMMDLFMNSTVEEQQQIKKRYSLYSVTQFLRNNPIGPSLSPEAVNKISVLLGIEGLAEYAFTDFFTNLIMPISLNLHDFNYIPGGNDRLPLSFFPVLSDTITFEEKVEMIIQGEEGIKIQTKSMASGKKNIFSADFAITTIPFSIFQLVNIFPYHSVSHKKHQAIRELKNIPAVKIGIEFKTRFWEQMQMGHITSSLPIRSTYIPAPASTDNISGVLLASYTWGKNAQLWHTVPEDRMIDHVLRDLVKIYGNIVYDEYIQGYSLNWTRNPYAGGCLTLFTPGQETDFGDYIQQPEGRIHFAGEHTSWFHGWAEGAVESGIRAAAEVNHRSSV
ncbi:flavin monoamine oxidase family protein [Virgibacillus sp. YIM 98842]|uniref:flavin monoamine oxidase family protein n=1 Tax=Virgibacillus sp. YIM 98842 TaxID=2663533 RepID=UPI001F098CCF|nr:flavin monoamine oxidase family protein [Virgibacillus sp. YIM 98842]